MDVLSKIKSDEVCVSCEVFPPKSGAGLSNARQVIAAIAETKPSFMSVTYGAGGTNAGEMLNMARYVVEAKVPAVAHLTCISADKAHIKAITSELKAAGVNSILALRGDVMPGQEPGKDYQHAIDLVRELKSIGGFAVGGACYPQGHPECGSIEKDIEYVKQKVEAGCDYLIGQMCFDNDAIFSFMYRLLAHGVNVPVIPGIMPVTNASQIKHIAEICGAKLPPAYQAIIEKFWDNPVAMQQAGIAYAIGQIVDLIANGFTNIHVYTMNKPDVIGEIRRSLSAIIV